MTKERRPRLYLPCAALPSQALALLLAGTAAAQDTTPEAIEMRPIVVTGTYLESEDAAGTLTVTPVELTEPINQGYSTVADVLRVKLPQYGGLGNLNPAFGNGGDGNSYLALRGLPGNATLVLVNGRRTAIGALNLIPDAAVEKIEILNDGGSAIYGSDAVAGVVNIILKKTFQGTRLTATYGFTTQSPNVNERKFQILSGDTTEKGNFVISAEYTASDQLNSRDRSPSNKTQATSSTGNPGTFMNNSGYGTHTNAAGEIIPNGVGLTWYVNPNATGGLTSSNQVPAGFDPLAYADTSTATSSTAAAAMARAEVNRRNALLGPDSAVLYGNGPRFPYPYYTVLYRPQAKYDFSGSGEYKLLGESVKLFTEAYYVNQKSHLELAPSTASLRIPLDNYWFQQVFPGNYTGSLSQRYRLVELGPRVYSDEFDEFRFVGGLRGDIADTTWKWEFGYLFDRNDQLEVASGGLEMSKMNALLGIAEDPSAWNPFGYTPIDGRSTLNDVSTLSDQGTYRWLVKVQGLDFNTSGEVVDLPGGAVKLALGLTERRETFDQAPDLAIKEGLISPYTVMSVYSAVRTIWGGYGELLVPVFGDDFRIPGFAELTVSTALRYEDYSDAGDTGVLPRVSGRWKPLEAESFAVRGSYAEGFSAPLFQDLYEPPTVSFFEVYDPFTGATSRPQEGVLLTGNLNLKPTESTTWLLGGEYAPKFVKSLTVGMDYYRIEQSGIPYSSIEYSVDQWYRAGGSSNPNNPWGPTALPSARNPAGTQVEYDDARQQFVQIRNQAPINAGDRFTDGLDFQVAQALETGVGMFTFSGLATYVLSFEQQDVAGAPMVDYLGRYWGFHAALPDTGYPEWRAHAAVAYAWKRVNAAFGFNYTAGYLETYNNGDRSVAPYITLDLRAGYRIPYVEADLLVGVNNLLDTDPPTVYNSFENNFDRAIGDPRGRMVFVSLSKTF